MGKTFGVERIVGKDVQLLALHFAETLALDAARLEFEVNAGIASGQVARAPRAPFVPAHVRPSAATAKPFF